MKNILSFLVLFSFSCFAQYTVQGTMTKTLESDWVILYKIEGAKQKFVQNSKITIDSILVEGNKQAVGNFSFTLPKDTKIGAYRVTYQLESSGFVDFIFNKEDVRFGFHPEYPNQSVQFYESKENIFYKNYLDAIAVAQQSIDSVQIASLRNPDLNLTSTYKDALLKADNIQESFLEDAKDLYIKPFIKASFRSNSQKLILSAQQYMSNLVNTFFDKIDFNDKTLLNSSFLVDRITDYVFYINYSDDTEVQERLFKESVDTVMSKINEVIFKKDIIEFLVGEFEKTKNVSLIDYLFENYYDKLPEGVQNKKYKTEKLALFMAEVGRTAPDFTWKEANKVFSLSTLNEADTYVLVFWSTSCSHCLREIPQLHKYLQENNAIKVVAFSLENDDFGWKNYIPNLPNWHHVLGLNKWENKIARTYNIMATPTYFILNTNKKIIAKPDTIKDVKAFLEL
ncbi:thioredoxin family protein [uncultured Polaribacter sp.]|uniref:TlpA family protein disulfide reductase n=1 Tax=uncultured Polaribacter sp. TaxID=174711 RepID=UPI00261E9880|nr:thioredoxin family protein [uncultured Polaribacter sp.]